MTEQRERGVLHLHLHLHIKWTTFAVILLVVWFMVIVFAIGWVVSPSHSTETVTTTTTLTSTVHVATSLNGNYTLILNSPAQAQGLTNNDVFLLAIEVIMGLGIISCWLLKSSWDSG